MCLYIISRCSFDLNRAGTVYIVWGGGRVSHDITCVPYIVIMPLVTPKQARSSSTEESIMITNHHPMAIFKSPGVIYQTELSVTWTWMK